MICTRNSNAIPYNSLLSTRDGLEIFTTYIITIDFRPNSPGPLTDDWKVMDDSSVNFHDVFFFIFCQIIAKNEEKHVMEIYG